MVVKKRLSISCLALLVALPVAGVAGDREPLRDAPVIWHEDDRNHIEKPEPRDPSIKWDYFEDSWGQPRERHTDPARLVRAMGTWFGRDPVRAAGNVNTLGEVPNSSWFTNRMGMFPMTPEQVAQGPGTGTGPDRSAPWVIVSAKTEGVTPGFNIRDAKGDVFVIKFDIPGALGRTVTAGVVANRILYGAGYNVPDDVSVTFSRDDLVLGEGVKIKTKDGKKRPMTMADIDDILDSVDRVDDDTWLALASKFLSGKPLGPFNYLGRRKDDPNDRVRHENRRELRGLEMFAAWINHFDTKQHNSLDMYVTEGGVSYVRHYLIDFASTLGVGATGLNPRYGYEYSFDPKASLKRLATLGLVEDRWRKRTRSHGFAEVGYLDSEYFEADKFRPLQPNTAFANHTDRDRYWAAKIIASFTDDHLRAIVAEARYREPGASEYVVSVLGELRDMIAQYAFARVPPLDHFVVRDDAVAYTDLGVAYGIFPAEGTRYRYRCTAVDADRKARDRRPDWTPSEDTRVPTVGDAWTQDDAAHPFVEVEVQVDRGGGWSTGVRAYVARASGRLVAVDR